MAGKKLPSRQLWHRGTMTVGSDHLYAVLCILALSAYHAYEGSLIPLTTLTSELLRSVDDLSCRAFDVHVIPYGAIGGLLSCESSPAGQESSSHAPSSHAPLLHGQAFCSLPITPTGLPVHVNGKSCAHVHTCPQITCHRCHAASKKKRTAS